MYRKGTLTGACRMKSVIYYFTGTGNSLAVAKKIAGTIGDCTIVSIASLKDTSEIIPGGERVGIICPVYFLGLPAMVASFARHIDLSKSTYTFAVVTFGGFGAGTALRQLDELFQEHTHRGLDAGFGVKMPGNYVLMYSPPAAEKQKRIFDAADKQISKIMKTISRNEHRNIPRSFIMQLLHNHFYVPKMSRVHDADLQFIVNDRCTFCGTCAIICPADNIVLFDGKPVWKHQCELCCGCIHICPVQAIQAGKATEKRSRYRHPSICVADLKQTREKIS